MRALQFDAQAVAALDRTLHEPARLSVLACLAAVDEADFVFLQSQTGMTGGNLSSHVKRLETAGYINMQKEFVDSKPRTTFQLTATGRAALTDYLKSMRPFISWLDEVLSPGGSGSNRQAKR